MTKSQMAHRKQQRQKPPKRQASKRIKKASIQMNQKDCKEESEALPFLAIMDNPLVVKR